MICRCCDYDLPEVDERVARHPAVEFMNLCDACACFGLLCAGGRADLPVREVPVGQLLAAIDVVVRRRLKAESLKVFAETLLTEATRAAELVRTISKEAQETEYGDGYAKAVADLVERVKELAARE